jgi:hypothetical protein
VTALSDIEGAAAAAMKAQLGNGSRALSNAIDFIVSTTKRDPNAVFVGSVPYLKLAGIVLCGWQMGRALVAATRHRAEDPAFYDAKIAIAQFYAEHVLVQAGALEASIVSAKSGESVLALTEEQF